MTIFDRNIDLKVDRVTTKKYKQLIIDDCYDNGRVYIVEDPNVDVENARITNVADAVNDADAVNLSVLKAYIEESSKKIIEAQLSCLVRYCTINLTDVDGLINALKAIGSYTMILHNESIEELKKYDVENMDHMEAYLRYLMTNWYFISHTSEEFTIDDVFDYTEKICNKIGFKIIK